MRARVMYNAAAVAALLCTSGVATAAPRTNYKGSKHARSSDPVVKLRLPWVTAGDANWLASVPPQMDCRKYSGGAWACGGTVGAVFNPAGVPPPAVADAPYYEDGYTAAGGSSAYFDGANSYFDAGDVLDQTGDLTICAVTKADSATGNVYWLSKDAPTDTNRGYVLVQAAGTTQCRIRIAKTNASGSALNSGVNAGIGAWSVCCASYDFIADGTSILRLNQDGISPAEVTNAVGPERTNTVPLRIGASSDSVPSLFFNGSIARGTLWNVAFTAVELDAMVRHYMGMLSQERYSVTVVRATTAYEQPFPQIPTGLLALMPANVLRVESTGALIESLRTNLALRSESFDTAATWIPVPTALDVVGTANTTAAPTGYVTADSMTDLSVAALGYRGFQQTIAVVNASKYGYSVYAKYKDYPYLMLTAARTAGLAYQTFNVQNGTVGATAANVTAVAITPAGNGFYRCMFEYTADAGSGLHSIYYDDTDDIAFTHVGVVGQGTYLFGAQLSLGNYTSSYIGPTAAISVQRNADYVSTVLPLTTGQTTWAVSMSATPEFNRLFQQQNTGATTASGLFYWKGTGGGSINTAMGYAYGSGSDGIYTDIFDSAATERYTVRAGVVSAATHNVIFTSIAGATNLAFDGVPVNSYAGAGTGVLTSIPTTIDIGRESYYGGGPHYWGGNIKNFTVCNSVGGGDWARCQ